MLPRFSSVPQKREDREKKDEMAQKNLKALTEEFPGNPVYDTEYAKAMGYPIPATVGPAN